MLLIDGKTCEDVDECAVDHNENAKHASALTPCNGGKCVNTPGSYSCVCSGGLRMATDGSSCLDLDECVINPDVCKWVMLCFLVLRQVCSAVTVATAQSSVLLCHIPIGIPMRMHLPGSAKVLLQVFLALLMSCTLKYQEFLRDCCSRHRCSGTLVNG